MRQLLAKGSDLYEGFIHVCLPESAEPERLAEASSDDDTVGG
jgi:hypothetical protein